MRFERALRTVDAHCEGEATRVVVGGLVDVPGETLFDKRRYLETERDDLRRTLLFEPRGQSCLSAVFVFPSRNPAADLGFVIMEGTDYPPMSGTNTINTVTVLLETGMLPMVEPLTELTLEAPAGLVAVTAFCEDGKCVEVTFRNVPSFATHLDAPVEVEGHGTLLCDVAYGGHFFGLVDANGLGFEIVAEEAADLAALGERIKTAIGEQVDVSHPDNPGIHDIGLFVWTGRPLAGGSARNATVVSPGRIDRSPCGTATTARMTTLAARGELAPGEEFLHESILSTTFRGKVVEEVQVGELRGVTTEVTGRAWIYSMQTLGIDPTDPFPTGYTLSDTWGTATPRPFDPATSTDPQNER
ncbi:MAG: proline racemase family protein [Actinobacteria bacterium]|nr:proline racemase family protein [Actinomycetota bacterium]